MPRATNNDGSLAYLNYEPVGGKCMIFTPCGNICLKILPEITDSKGATYVAESTPGRTTPLMTYAHSDARTINTELHFMVTKANDIIENMGYLRILQNLVYPGNDSIVAPYTPPPVVRFVCGSLMDGRQGLCLIMKNYSVRYPTEVAWDAATFLPYRFSVSCSWEVIYACSKIPSNQCIVPGSIPFYPDDVSGVGFIH